MSAPKTTIVQLDEQTRRKIASDLGFQDLKEVPSKIHLVVLPKEALPLKAQSGFSHWVAINT